MTHARNHLTDYHSRDAENSVSSVWLAHLTDDEIRAGIEAQKDKLLGCAGIFPGADVKGARSLSEALSIGGADFNVIKRPIMAVIDSETAVAVPGAFATLRDDSMTPLGKRVVGEGYKVIQNGAAFAAADVLIRDGAFHPAAVDVRGARVSLAGFIGADAVQTLSGAPDIIAHFATFSTAHDGTAHVEAALSTLRIACFNGMTSREHVASVKIRHTRNADEKIVEAAQAIFKLRDAAVRETAVFQRLAQTRMNGAEFATFANSLLDDVRGALDDEKDGCTSRKRDKREREVDELLGLFHGSRGTSTNHGVSAWDGYNSVTEWLDHKLARGGVSDIQRRLKAFDSNDNGHGNKVKARALRLLTR